jgi:hypothetical protein
MSSTSTQGTYSLSRYLSRYMSRESRHPLTAESRSVSPRYRAVGVQSCPSRIIEGQLALGPRVAVGCRPVENKSTGKYREVQGIYGDIQYSTVVHIYIICTCVSCLDILYVYIIYIYITGYIWGCRAHERSIVVQSTRAHGLEGRNASISLSSTALLLWAGCGWSFASTTARCCANCCMARARTRMTSTR